MYEPVDEVVTLRSRHQILLHMNAFRGCYFEIWSPVFVTNGLVDEVVTS